MIESESIKKARNVDLAAFLLAIGEKLKKNGTRYRHLEHNSLVFTKNSYFWNSRNESGNTIDYLVKYLNIDFDDAVKALCEFEGEIVKEKQEKEFTFEDIKFTKDIKRTISYLIKTRGLKNDIVQFFINLGVIKQTAEKNNIAFLMLGKCCEIVGIEYNTTLSNRRFKGIEKNSRYGYGFNIRNTNEVENAFLFESAIDLMSFIQYIGLEKTFKLMDNSIFISMAGLKQNVLDKTIELYSPKEIFLAVDNDEAGLNFVNNIRANEKYKDFEIKYIFPAKHKDWNDLYKK